MSKYNFRPESVNVVPSIPLLVLVSCISLCSSATLGLSHGFVDRIACSCLTILASNMWYILLTGVQCLKFQFDSLCKQTKRRGSSEILQKKREAVMDNRLLPETTSDTAMITGQYTLRTLLINTIEFRHSPREVRLFVSRKELWFILYPIAFAVFVLFYCIPMYDISCTVSLIAGLLSKSTYDEINRGIYWKRNTGRKICFVIATIFGFMCVSGLFVLDTVVNRQVGSHVTHSNSSVVSLPQLPPTNVSVSSDTENMIGTLLHGDGLRNDNSPHHRWDANGTNTSHSALTDSSAEYESHPSNPSNLSNVYNNISDENLDTVELNDVTETLSRTYTASMQSPNLLQKILLYSVCSYIPFFLDRTPDSIRLPVLLEIVQPSVSCIAAFVLFLVCITTHGVWLPDYMLQSPTFALYVCLIPLGVWCCIFFVIRASRAKTASYVCCILMLVVYIKLLHITNQLSQKTLAIRQISVFVGFMCAFYVALMTVFIRMENKCIQMGWDTSRDNDNDDDDDYMSSDGVGIHMQDSHNVSPRYCIEDVLQRVTHDIQTTEYILSHPKTVVSPAVYNTATERDTSEGTPTTQYKTGEENIDSQTDPQKLAPVRSYRNNVDNSELSSITEFIDCPEDHNSKDIAEDETENISLLSPSGSTKINVDST